MELSNDYNGHVAYSTFGRAPDGSIIDAFRYLKDFSGHMAKNDIRFKDGYQKQAMLRQLYYEMFGIADPGKSNSPLDLVRMHSKQGHAGLGPLQHCIEKYRLSGVYDVYHLTLDAYLELDYPTAMWILESSKILFDKVERDKTNAINGLFNSMK